jgi:5-keto 4-deoxyuronate isomerase
MRWCLSGEGKLLERRYLMESLLVSIPALLIITHGKSFILGGVFPLQGHDDA